MIPSTWNTSTSPDPAAAYEVRCAEIWGGIRNRNQDVHAAGLNASLFSSSASGGKGGDIYYLSVCDAGDLARVAIVDVVGHGEAVSAVSQWLYEALDRHMNDGNGAEILTELNTLVARRGLEAMATASLVGYFQPANAGLFAYAGHHPALVLRRGEDSWSSVAAEPAGDPSNIPLGVVDESGFGQAVVPLTSGDRLFLYTDGVTEAPAPGGEPFGVDRLHRVLENHRSAPLSALKRAVLKALLSHTGGTLEHDDVSVIVLEVAPDNHPIEPVVAADTAIDG